MPETPTREIFAHFPFWKQLVFYIVAGGASLACLYGFYRRFQKYRRGRSVNRFDHLGQRLARAMKIIAQNRTVFARDTYAGLSHFLIFWGFIFLFIGTVIVFIDHDILRFLGVKILQGTFYLWFSVILDIWGVLFLIGLAMMFFRRSLFGLPQLNYARADSQNGQYDRSGYATDDRLFLGLLFLIGVTGFLIEGFRIAEFMPPFERWSPVGWLIAKATTDLGLHASVVTLHVNTWWIHAIMVIVFLAYLPYSKATHIFTDTANLIFKDEMVARRLPKPAEGAPKPGYHTITDFTWKELLDLDACTKCGRCHVACPANAAGTLDNNLQGALQNLGEYGNSFGQSPKNRAKWAQKLSFKIKDARKEQVEYLWYVGDFASFDPRLQNISRTVGEVFNQAGVDFGILHDGEKNSGNDVRRVGEEGLFEMLVEDNTAALKKAKFKEIVTTDPHTLNTFRNEYPEFGGNYTIHHYTGLLAKLIDEGKLKFTRKLNYKVTYHDPCYLARYNRETNAPRQVMQALGLELREMPRCRENTFCCGAGGGRIWMDTSNETNRTSEQRIKEALGVGEVQYFITTCPKDYTMYTDAVKTSGNEGKIEVKDLIELVAEAMG